MSTHLVFGTAWGWMAVAASGCGVTYARAGGLALVANPVPIAAPCHRIGASHGGLGGFTGGLRVKRRLLALEGSLPHLTI